MLRGLNDKVKTNALIAPAALAASTLSAATDLQGKRNFAFLIQVGSFAFTGVNSLTVTIHESDTSGGTYAAHAGSGSLVLNDQATQENKVHVLEYKGNKRFVKLDIVEAGTVSAPMAVSGLCTDNEIEPAQ